MGSDEPEKTAAITSRSAVIAALLLAGAILVAAIVLQGCEGDGATPDSDNEFEGRLTPAPRYEGVRG